MGTAAPPAQPPLPPAVDQPPIQTDLPTPPAPPVQTGATGSSRAAPRRKAKQARFISADAIKTRIQLGADGRLPELALDEAVRRKDKPETSKSSNSLILVGVLLFSVVVSIVMLFVESSDTKSESRAKSEARESIALWYTGQGQEPPLDRYQRLLRESLQAHSRGDFAKERRNYRRVLDMLHSEDKNDVTGLTGALGGTEAPNDKDLQRRLATLLRQ